VKYKSHNIFSIFANMLTKNGKRQVGIKLFLATMGYIKIKTYYRKHPVRYFSRFFLKYRPSIGFKSKYVAGSKVKIPLPIPIRQQYTLLAR
jgi:ribosomal protein S7